MFWGLQMEPNLRYSQQVPEGFRITKATLSTDKPPARAKDPAGKLVQVFVDQDGNEYAIATLKHGEIYDCSLDLRFAEGEDICFYLKGDGIVFLTGHNLYPDDPNDETFCLRSDAISDTSSDEDLEVDDCDEDADGPEIEDITERASKVKRNSLKPSNGIAEKKSVEAESSEEDEEDDDEDDLDSMDESDSMDENEEDEDESDEDENESAADQDEEEDAKGTTAPGSKRPDSFLRKISPDPKKPKLRSPSPTSQPRQNGHASQSAKRAEGGDKKESVKELVVKDIKVGSGPVAKKGKTVRVYYVGKLLNGKTFDQVTNGPPFQFKLGTASVIQGWDKGLEGMRVGGKRRLIIPSSLAYGKQKMGPIPAGSALQFEIELKAIV